MNSCKYDKLSSLVEGKLLVIITSSTSHLFNPIQTGRGADCARTDFGGL